MPRSQRGRTSYVPRSNDGALTPIISAAPGARKTERQLKRRRARALIRHAPRSRPNRGQVSNLHWPAHRIAGQRTAVFFGVWLVSREIWHACGEFDEEMPYMKQHGNKYDSPSATQILYSQCGRDNGICCATDVVGLSESEHTRSRLIFIRMDQTSRMFGLELL
jgi:hypothetical protein